MDKRRSSRMVLALPITVRGVDALHEPFTERTTTVMVSCHGCKYQARHYVSKGAIVTLEIPRSARGATARSVEARVIWVQRPRNAREILHIGLEFETPGNVWDIPLPPDDWFPLPGEPAFTIEETPPAPSPYVPPAPPVTLTASWDASEILVMASRAEGREAELEVARQTAMNSAATAIADGMNIIRQRVDTDLHGVIEETLKASIDRLSETAVQKIVQQAADRTAELVDEARKAFRAVAEEMDAKIQNAVQEAVKNMPNGRHGRSRNRR